MTLKKIDFSEGVKNTEIQENFEDLQDQLSVERLTVGGSGVIDGLKPQINDFTLSVDSGRIVDKDGMILEIEKQELEIEKPILLRHKQKSIVTENGEIQLMYRPYSINRDCTSEFEEDRTKRNVLIKSAYDTKKIIPSIDIKNRTVLVDARKYGRIEAVVDYNYALPRYDTIYIETDKEHNNKPIIKIIQGTSSVSPDIVLPEEYKFIIGVIKIDPHRAYSDNTIRANASIYEAFKQYRNITTDKDNNLLICGDNYRDMRLVSVNEPKNPKKDSLWYDKNNNIIKIWTVDKNDKIENGYWKTLNAKSHININECKIWKPEDNPEDRQTFLFNPEELNLRFTPGVNALSIIIDNKQLMSDQFDEIIDHSSALDNAGIGFKLASPLTNKTYVEVKIAHQVIASPKQIFQRASTFIYTYDYTINKIDDSIKTEVPYLIGHEQLEVYINGKRLNKSEFIEGTDLKIKDRKKGTKSYEFKVTDYIENGDVITYKISTNIYSYNSLMTLLGDAKEDMNSIMKDSTNASKEVTQKLDDFMNSTNPIINSLKENVTNISNDNNTLKKFKKNTEENLKSHKSTLEELKNTTFKKTDILTASNLPKTMLIPTGIINFAFDKSGEFKGSEQITLKSFLTLYDLKNSKLLVKGSDYELEKDPLKDVIRIKFINEKIEDGTKIYAMGIKFE